MRYDKDLSDLQKRLDDLEKRLAEKKEEIRRTGDIPPHHQEKIDEIHAKTGAMKQKILEPKESRWEAARHELEADWDALAHTFEHWLSHVDKEYQSRKS